MQAFQKMRIEKGEKDFLIYTKNNQPVKVLDLVGGFGSGLHGHNHPALQETIIQFLKSVRPAINTQGSHVDRKTTRFSTGDELT